YHAFYEYEHNLWQLVRGEPATVALPARRDTNGHWGAPVEGIRLAVRFHRREFLPGEPVLAMILLRNASLSGRYMYLWSPVEMDFEYIVHYGTNVFTWSRPKPPPPKHPTTPFQSFRADGFQMDAHTQVAEFVQ